MKRQHTIAGLLCTAALSAALSATPEVVPAKLDFSRYQGMLDKSPFAVATAATPAPAAANFAKDLYIANAAHGPDGDMVTLASSADKNFKKYLTTNSPVDGFGISNVEWSDKVGGTKVTISKDGQFATLTFNQALLTQPIAGGAPGGSQPGAPPPAMTPAPVVPTFPQPAVPGAASNAPSGGIKPAPIPMLPTPPPHTRPTISRLPGATATPQL